MKKFQEYNYHTNRQDITISQLISNLDKGVWKIPSGQRLYVWDRAKANRLINRLFTLPVIPAIIIYTDNSGQKLIWDGQQRCKTIHYFVKGYFVKKGSPFVISSTNSALNKKRYIDLDEHIRYHFDNLTLPVQDFKILEDEDKSKALAVNLFTDINNSYVKTSNMEIRKMKYFDTPFYNLLLDLNEYKSYQELFSDKFKSRMWNIELLLRIIYLINKIIKSPNYTGSIGKSVLDETMEFNKNVSDVNGQDLFKKATKIIDDKNDKNKLISKMVTKRETYHFESILLAMMILISDNKKIVLNNDRLKLLEKDKKYQHWLDHNNAATNFTVIKKRVEIAKQYLLGN